MVRILDDFKVHPSGRNKPAPDPDLPHKHYPIHVQYKTEFQPINPGNDRICEKVQFAYFYCKDCEQFFREKVKDLDES